MQISVGWLREWVDIGSDISKLAEDLTLAGLEVSAVEPVTQLSPKIVVGEIIGIRAHRSKRTLRVCEVALGRARPVRIVCGAANARTGVKVPVALPGSILPGREKVKRVKIAGEVSEGIICSAAEIGLEEVSDGILEFDETATVGQAVNEHLDLDDAVLDVELTPNRGDCLSALGLAREIAAIRGKSLMDIELHRGRSAISTRIPLSVDAPTDAPRYVGRVIEGLDPTSATPDWMKERLRRSGLRSLGPIVDTTNYVMLELGQPLHAFDLRSIHGSIVVRHARACETLVLLDGTDLLLAPETLVIADERGPIGLAGIMGGQNSSVTERTEKIFLESAYFRPSIIGSRARQYGLQTDASYRFERGVDPRQQRRAVIRASALLSNICSGQAGPVSEVFEKACLPKKKSILLRKKRLHRVLGVEVSARDIKRVLYDLSLNPIQHHLGWKVKPPSYRFDIEGEHDLVEEVGRLYGFTNIPSRTPHLSTTQGLDREEQMPLARLQDYLVDRDYNEVITYSFVDGVLQTRLDPQVCAVELSNSIASNMNVMRTSLWPGLLNTVSINYRRQIRRIRLFEIGHVFSRKEHTIIETERLGGIACGLSSKLHWDDPQRSVDYFDIKGDLEGMLGLDGQNISYTFVPARHPTLHPGQSAEIRDGSNVIGHIGLLRPDIQEVLDFDFPVYLFEIHLNAICHRVIPTYRRVSRYPWVSRDISVVISEQIPAGKVEKAIWAAGGRLLTSVRLFDVYVGKPIEKQKKSLSFRLTLQSSSRNLTDREVETVLRRIVTALQKLGGQLRSEFDQKS
jgi:phenylalanyl-tRNA synthetase beta chain